MEFLSATWKALSHDLLQKPGLDLLGRDLPMVAIATLGWTILHLAFTFLFTKPFGKYWVVVASAGKANQVKNGTFSTKPTEADYLKFETAAWRALAFAVCDVFGAYALWNEPFMWVGSEVAKDWPRSFPQLVEFYYILTMSHYIHATIVMFWQPKQSDFWQMFTHHIAALSLLGFSYVSAWFEIGSRIIFLTELADPIMEFGKCVLYGGWTKVADVFFGVFATFFITTRCIAYPLYCIIPAINYRYVNDGGPVPFWNFSFFWVLTLQALYFFWSALILRMVHNVFVMGGARGDIRDVDEKKKK